MSNRKRDVIIIAAIVICLIYAFFAIRDHYMVDEPAPVSHVSVVPPLADTEDTEEAVSEEIQAESEETATEAAQESEKTEPADSETAAEEQASTGKEAVNEASAGEPEEAAAETAPATATYRFRNKKLLSDHYNKHGIDMGFASASEYEAAAAAVVLNPNALHKTEKEDGDDVYYIETTNEFVVVSTDGYIRTYFCPDSGIKYYNKQ